jgi:peroxisomal membrane protein 4
MIFLFRSGTLREKIHLVYKATRQHASNLARFALLYKSGMILLRKANAGKEAPVHSFLSGLHGGYWVFGHGKGAKSSVNQQIVIYVFARVILALAKLAVQPPGDNSLVASSYGGHGGKGLLTLSEEQRAFVKRYSWPVFASMSWASVMWLFEGYPETLQPSLRSSMTYMYVGPLSFAPPPPPSVASFAAAALHVHGLLWQLPRLFGTTDTGLTRVLPIVDTATQKNGTHYAILLCTTNEERSTRDDDDDDDDEQTTASPPPPPPPPPHSSSVPSTSFFHCTYIALLSLLWIPISLSSSSYLLPPTYACVLLLLLLRSFTLNDTAPLTRVLCACSFANSDHWHSLDSFVWQYAQPTLPGPAGLTT